MNEIIHLYHLQTIDHQLDKIERRLVEINELLDKRDEVIEAQLLVETAKDTAKRIKTKLSELETAIEKQGTKIGLDEAALYGGRIQNPKELQDLQSEITSLKKHQHLLEEQILETMLALEESEKKMEDAEALLAQTEAKDLELKSSLLGEQSSLIRQKSRLQAERIAAANSLSSDFQEVYMQLRLRKRGTAVSLIIDGGCSSCGSTLTPAEKQAARSPSNVTYCSSCGRILYAG